MYEDNKVSKLVIHIITQEKYQELLDSGQLDDNAIYMTDKNPSYTPPLLQAVWSDHLLDDISWLRADTFSWHFGDMYLAAYNHLERDLTGAVEQTETINGITIKYFLTRDKHRICLPDQEDALLALYNNIGIAWYYIIDTENRQFKLPRTKYGFTGIEGDTVGEIKISEYAGALGNPDWDNKKQISSGFITPSNGYIFGGRGAGDDMSGQISVNGNTVFLVSTSHGGNVYGVTTVGVGDTITLGHGIYYFVPCKPLSVTAETRAMGTQQYLYFYVGVFDKESVIQTAGMNAEMFANKMDVGTPLIRDIFSPDEWENNSMEQILSAGVGSGNLVFTKNWQEFDYLWFSSVSDGSNALDDSPHWLNVKWMLSQAKAGVTNLAVARYASGAYWYVNPQTWTETTMPVGSASESLFINRVYGIKLKNITAKNVGFLNYKGLFDTASDLASTTPTDMGQWAIVASDETQRDLQTKYFSTKDVDGNYVWAFGGIIDSSLVGCDYVVESQLPTEANGHTWYRKYKSGWVEQGGHLTATSDSQIVTVTLPVEMFDDKYNCSVSFWFAGAGTANYQFMCPRQITTTSFVITIYKTSSQGSSWYVSGMSAQ